MSFYWFAWFLEGKNCEEVVLELSLDATACPCKSYSMFWMLATVARENLQLFATDPMGRKEHMDGVCAQSGKKQAGGFNALLLFCYSTQWCHPARWAAPCTSRNLGLLEGVEGNEWEDKDYCVSASRAVAFPNPSLWSWLHWMASLREGRIATTVEDHVFSTDCLKNHIFTSISMW